MTTNDSQPSRDHTHDDPNAVAEQRFIHGLLSFQHQHSARASEARIQRVMDAISAEHTADSVTPSLVFRRVVHRHWRSVSSLAATAIIIISLLITMMLLPSGPSAYAVIQASLSATATAGAHRYEIYAALPHEQTVKDTPIAVLDIADANHRLFMLNTPQGDVLVSGCNEAGEWSLRRDGTIERFAPGMARPRWANIGETTVFASSINDLIDEFGDHYDFAFAADAALPQDDTGAVFTRITGTHRNRPVPFEVPATFEFWIDPATNMIQRLEIAWALPTPEQEQAKRLQQPRPGDPVLQPPSGQRSGGPGRGGPIPPRLIVYQLVPAPDFTTGWFDPETYQDGG